jgi:hypothetical protein
MDNYHAIRMRALPPQLAILNLSHVRAGQRWLPDKRGKITLKW